MRRFVVTLVAPVVAVASLVATATEAKPMNDRAITEAAAALPPNRFLWTDDVARPGAVSVLISVPDQRAYVFRGKKMIAASSVSTGSDDKPTPLGSFAILQKKAVYKSNLYDDAPMPFMQRLTWDGVAIHAGRNPGFPASHGCVRLPTAFAKKLFEVTELGATVEVTDVAYVSSEALPASEAELTARADTAARGVNGRRQVVAR